MTSVGQAKNGAPEAGPSWYPGVHCAAKADPDRPAFRGNGPDDYVCVRCGNVLAEGMHAMQMTKKVRVRCGRCSTVNVATESPAGESR